jgi:polyisoprenoid-binding protein YceI
MHDARFTSRSPRVSGAGIAGPPALAMSCPSPRWVLAAGRHLRGLSVLAVGLLLPVHSEAQTYHVDLARENRVRFLSDAPLEDFEGVTDRIDGFVYLDGEGLGGDTDLGVSEFHFEVDLASLDTGIGLRNRHMRDRYLETKSFPFAVYAGRIKSLDPASAEGFRAVATGDLSIHGVERRREIECRVDPVGVASSPGMDALRVRCSFTVALPDHDIPIPRLMFMRIDEVMELDLDFYLTPADREEV